MSSELPKTASRSPHGWISKALVPDGVCLLVIACVCLKVVWAIDTVNDIGLTDETIYLGSGVQIHVPGYPNGDNGFLPAEWGPLYSFWYAFQHLFCPSLVRLYFLNWSVLLLLTSLASFVLQRAIGAPALLALVSTSALATSHYFEVWPYPMHFATVLLLCGSTMVVRSRTRGGAIRWASLTFLIGAFVRPEFAVAFLLTVLYALGEAVVALRARRLDIRRAVLRSLPVLVLLAVLLRIFGSPLGGGRAYFAFQQHYAVEEVKRLGLNIDPWQDWPAIMVRDFGKAASLSEAIQANPRAFAMHLWHDAIAVGDEFPRTFEPMWMLGPTAHHIVQYTFAVLVALGFLGVLMKMRSGAPEERTRLRRYALLATAVVATITPSVLIVYPRLHYFLPVTALAMVGTSAGLPTAFEWLWAKAKRTPWTPVPRKQMAWLLAAACALLVLTPNRAYGWCVQSALLGKTPGPPRFAAPTIAGLERLGIKQHVVVLEPVWGYALYSMPDHERVRDWEKDRPFLEYIRKLDISVIVLPRAVQRLPFYRDDASFVTFLSDPTAYGFSMLEIPGTKEEIAIRNDVHVDPAARKPAP